ncbi:MAG: DUF2147 domain-containing protein [Pararhizobium sp.]
MLRTLMLTAATVLGLAAHGVAADAIVGDWKATRGETVAISPCGGAYCYIVKTGKHAGKTIGKVHSTGASYEGEISDPDNGNVYGAFASVSGPSLKMKGCYMKVLCKTQTWSRL